MNSGSDIAFVDGHLEPIVDFPWHEIEPEQQEWFVGEVRRQVSRALARYNLKLLEFGGGRGLKKFWQAAHAFAFANYIHPEQDKSVEEIAAKFGISKQALSKQVNHIRDAMSVARLAGAKSMKARKTYKRTATKSHEKRKRSFDNGKPARNFAAQFAGANMQERNGH